MGEKLQGRCPMGCGETLFVGSMGYITCSWHKCPNPTAVADLLDDPLLSEHVVRFGEVGFDIQHPLAERGQDLVACELHQHIRSLDGPPVRPGRYVATRQDDHWFWQTLPAESPQPHHGAPLAGALSPKPNCPTLPEESETP